MTWFMVAVTNKVSVATPSLLIVILGIRFS
jgi:hypothetical protein